MDLQNYGARKRSLMNLMRNLTILNIYIKYGKRTEVVENKENKEEEEEEKEEVNEDKEANDNKSMKITEEDSKEERKVKFEEKTQNKNNNDNKLWNRRLKTLFQNDQNIQSLFGICFSKKKSDVESMLENSYNHASILCAFKDQIEIIKTFINSNWDDSLSAGYKKRDEKAKKKSESEATKKSESEATKKSESEATKKSNNTKARKKRRGDSNATKNKKI